MDPQQDIQAPPAATPPWHQRALAALGAALLARLAAVGALARLAAALLFALGRGRCDRRELARAMWQYGARSLPVVGASAGFAGVIMVVQVALWVRRLGAEELVGWFAGFASLRELVPILVALMFSGRVGARHAAELATWQGAARLDVLRVLGVDVYAWLLVPRVLSMVLGMVALVALGDAAALACAAAGARAVLGIAPEQFWRSLAARLTPGDVLIGLEKAAAFGATIALSATHCGLTARGGARGVGAAVHAQVVGSALGIFALDGCFAGATR